MGLQMVEWFMRKAAGMKRTTNRRLAECLGWIWRRVDRRHREIVLRNLKLAYGDELDQEKREAICRQVFNHFARVVLEIPYLWMLNPANVDEFATFSGLEHFEAARKKGKGILVFTAHFGNWEIMALAFSLRYYTINFVVRPLDNPDLDKLIDKVRCRTGNRTIPKKGSVRQLLRLIRQKEIVALLIDQNVDWYDGVFVPFFREIACTNKAAAILALRTGIPVVPILNARQPDGRYHVFVLPEVPLINTGDLIRDTEENIANFNRIIEQVVRRNPEQWFWMHQRWKTRPYQPWPWRKQ
jgi:KDO2-lipid IV(A) lauroyltransferase